MKNLDETLEPIREAKRLVGQEIAGLTFEELQAYFDTRDRAFQAEGKLVRDVDLAWLRPPANAA